jgi:YfiH family protein
MVTTVSAGDMKDVARRRTFCQSRNMDFVRLTMGSQVHGAQVAVVDTKNCGQLISETDSLITGIPGIPLGVYTADCVPVFVAAKNGMCGGVIHAGWRGMAAGAIRAAVHMLCEQFSVASTDIIAAVGPHIQSCCYTVNADVLELFSQIGPALDLGIAAVGQLRKSGIEDIVSCGRCTHHEPDLFYSYRRNKTPERMLSIMVL